MGQEEEGPGTLAQRQTTQRRVPGHTHRKGMPHQRDQHRPTPSGHRATPGGARPPTHAAEARTGRRTDRTGSRPPLRGRRAHPHGERGLHPHREPPGTPPRSPRPRPHRQATTAATARATTQAPEEEKDMVAAHRARGGTPRGHRTNAPAPREGNPADTHLIHQPERHTRTPTARIQRATPHLTAPPSQQPATKR